MTSFVNFTQYWVFRTWVVDCHALLCLAGVYDFLSGCFMQLVSSIEMNLPYNNYCLFKFLVSLHHSYPSHSNCGHCSARDVCYCPWNLCSCAVSHPNTSDRGGSLPHTPVPHLLHAGGHVGTMSPQIGL